MAFELTGKLVDVQPIQKISDSFQKRDFAIETTSTGNNGMTYTNYAAFQLTNNACQLIDRFQIGQEVKVSFDIRGNKWEKDGQTRYFSNLSAWRIEPPMAAPQMQQGYAQPQQGGYAQPQQQFNQAPQQQPFNNPPAQQGGTSFDPGGADDLPF